MDATTYKLVVGGGPSRYCGPPLDFEAAAEEIARFYADGERHVEVWTGVRGDRRATTTQLAALIERAASLIGRE